MIRERIATATEIRLFIRLTTAYKRDYQAILHSSPFSNISAGRMFLNSHQQSTFSCEKPSRRQTYWWHYRRQRPTVTPMTSCVLTLRCAHIVSATRSSYCMHNGLLAGLPEGRVEGSAAQSSSVILQCRSLRCSIDVGMSRHRLTS
jgi:hypothetical protein